MFFRQKSTTLSDADLVSAFKKSGDLTLASELFSRYTAMLYGVCLKYLRDRDDARDAVMQVFEKLPETLKKHEIANFKSWIYVTARNHCLMQLRAKKGNKSEEIDEQRMESSFLLHPEDESELENDLGKLEKCIGTLADDQQQCVRLFYLEEKSYKDIADVTGFDMNKVKSYIQNGKRNLKICMEKNE